jgi:formylglycine-generating enzyme
VNWNDAKEYTKWLSKKLNVEVRLPTEAEWEYVCRAGTTTPFNTGESLTKEQANYYGSYVYNGSFKGDFIGKAVPVKSYPPNAWGVYDMHGNVWEWCEDWYDENYYYECARKGTVKNPLGSENGVYRVIRGGAWSDNGIRCRSAERRGISPVNRDLFTGFRVVIVP